MPKSDPDFLTPKDKDMYFHLNAKLPKSYSIFYDDLAPKGYFEIFCDTLLLVKAAYIITNSKGEACVYYPWYVNKTTRRMLQNIIDTCPKSDEPTQEKQKRSSDDGSLGPHGCLAAMRGEDPPAAVP